MTEIKDDNWRFIFQLIKNHTDKQEKKIQDMQKELDNLLMENMRLNNQVQKLAQHAIIDNVQEKGGSNDE